MSKEQDYESISEEIAPLLDEAAYLLLQAAIATNKRLGADFVTQTIHTFSGSICVLATVEYERSNKE